MTVHRIETKQLREIFREAGKYSGDFWANATAFLNATLAEQVPEEEWEWGWQSYLRDGEEYGWRSCFSREEAEEEIRIFTEQEVTGGRSAATRVTYELRQRVKPGPWLIPDTRTEAERTPVEEGQVWTPKKANALTIRVDDVVDGFVYFTTPKQRLGSVGYAGMGENYLRQNYTLESNE